MERDSFKLYLSLPYFWGGQFATHEREGADGAAIKPLLTALQSVLR